MKGSVTIAGDKKLMAMLKIHLHLLKQNTHIKFISDSNLQKAKHFSTTHTTISFNFIHYFIQELLAPHCIANLPPGEEF